MTDPPTPEELAAELALFLAAEKVEGTAYKFQLAALKFTNTETDDDEYVPAARDYVKRMRAHQKAVEEAHEAFKEPSG